MLNDLPLMGFIRDKMKWHQSRQTVLASNVANADTPGYRPNDLKELKFDRQLAQVRKPIAGMAITHTKHINVASSSREAYDSRSGQDFEVTPSGNGVVLEDQMMKVASNQFDYQLATSVYSRSLGLLKIAIGRS